MATTIKISALPAASGIDASNDYLPIVQSGVTNKINRTTLLGITGSPVGTSDTQVLTNKTIGNTNTVTLKDTLFTLQDDGDATKQANFQLSGITAGQTRVITLPDASLTMVGTATIQTLTNKTLTTPTITSPSITGTVGGSATYSTPTLTVPVIADFSSAQHAHTSAATGGTLKITAGGASTGLVDQSGLALDVEARAGTTFANFVESGCVWTQIGSPSNVAGMTSGFVWIGGRRIPVSAVASQSFTVSKDTYIDVNSSGTITYTVNTTNAAAPALAANSIRLAILVMGGVAMTINQGSPTVTVPVVSSVISSITDDAGNMIYPTKPSPGMLSYRQATTTQNVSATGTGIALTGLSCTVVITAGQRIKVSAFCPFTSDTNITATMFIYQTNVSGAVLTKAVNAGAFAGNIQIPMNLSVVLAPAAGTYTYIAAGAVSSGNADFTAAPTFPMYIMVELV